MAQNPAPDHPDHWIHERLKVIEKALHALLRVARDQPGLTADTAELVLDAEYLLSKNQQTPPPGNAGSDFPLQ